MDDLTAKKLGEVLAFARVGHETFERGAAGFIRVFGSEGHREIVDDYLEELEKIDAIATQFDGSAATFNKAEKTGQKLRAMRDMYIGGEWDNPVELLEWLGFFEGAAIVHWQLVGELARKHDQKDLAEVCATSLDKHKNIFERVLISIKRSFGKQR